MTDLSEQVQSDLARVREAYRVCLTQDIVDAIDRLTAAFTTLQVERDDADCERMATAVAIAQANVASELAAQQAEIERLTSAQPSQVWAHRVGVLKAQLASATRDLIPADECDKTIGQSEQSPMFLSQVRELWEAADAITHDSDYNLVYGDLFAAVEALRERMER